MSTDLSQLSDAALLRLSGADIPAVVKAASAKYGIPEDLMHAMIRQESGGNQSAVSPKGAKGIMQLMPGTAKDLGVNRDDWIDNILGGAKYLKQQYDSFGSWDKALWAYNAGPERAKRGIMPTETKGYLENILGVFTPKEAEAAAPSPVSALSDYDLVMEARKAGIYPSPVGEADKLVQNPVEAAPRGPAPVIKSAIPDSAPEWAKNNPGMYWKVVDAVKVAETPGDIAALLAGGKIGATGGAVAGPLGALAGGVTGAGLAYAAKSFGMDALKQYLGLQEPYTLTEGAAKAPERIAEGSMMEMAGGIGGKVLPKVIEAGGAVAKSTFGRLSGTGTGAVEEVIKSGEATGLTGNPFKSMTHFDRALRRQISGEEVVSNAKDALNVMKGTRAAEYQAQLAKISQNQQPIDLTSLKQRADILLQRFVRFQNGQPDWSRSAIGPESSEGTRKLKELYTLVKDWGSKAGDDTPLGLDMLKRQLDDFWSESSNARAFTSSLRDEVRSTLVSAVPEYGKMTKSYAEATRLIKDIESGLMLRKQGMTGRIVSDQTLRRLTSAMRDNFQLRADLVKALSEGGGEDITGQIAGNAMSQVLPRGLAGTGPVLAGEAALVYLNPKMWPILLASSPRVQGEFLRLYGKGLSELRGSAAALGKIGTYEAAEQAK